jgi:hypothetical protein
MSVEIIVIVLINNAIPIDIGSSILNDRMLYFELRKRSYEITKYENSSTYS